MDDFAGEFDNHWTLEDEDYEEYLCAADMDEDDYARLMNNPRSTCPFYQNGDEYRVVRKQM